MCGVCSEWSVCGVVCSEWSMCGVCSEWSVFVCGVVRCVFVVCVAAFMLVVA